MIKQWSYLCDVNPPYKVIHHYFNNGDNRDNTMNKMVKMMLSTKPETFDLKKMEDLVNNGATFCCSNNKNNTVSVALKSYKESCEFKKPERKLMYKNNMLKLLDFMIAHNAKPCNSQDQRNSLSLAIETNDLDIIQKISRMNPIPDNSMALFNTLNPENVNEPIESKLPCSLAKAQLTKNPDIINIAKNYCAQVHTSLAHN